MTDFVKFVRRFPPLFWTFLAAGVVLRAWTLFHTWNAPLPPDLWTYLSLAENMTRPFDTGIREPLFVWYCKALMIFWNDPERIFLVLRAMGVPFFIATIFLTYRLGCRVFSVPVALGACFLLAVNWSQIENDLNGLRNTWEGLFVLAILLVLYGETFSALRWAALAALSSGFALLKFTFLPTAVLVFPVWFRARRWKLGLAGAALAVMIVAALPHFANNRRIGGNFFYSSNFLTRNFRNLEFAGRPGFPTPEQVKLDAWAGPPVTTWEMMFVLHSPWQAVWHTAEGAFNLVWGTAASRYFAKNTAWFLYAFLLPCYLAGTFFLLRARDGRLLFYFMVCFVLPFAFFQHVYWAYRYVVPLAPLAGLAAFAGLAGLTRAASGKKRRSAAAPAAFRTVRDTRGAFEPEISFLVPAYNEEKNIADILTRLSALPLSKEIIVVDDGSTDSTRSKLSAVPSAETLVLFHERNAGKGAAIRTALSHARGRTVAVQDADGEYDPAEYPVLLKTLREHGLRAVYGSRFLTKNPTLYRRYLLGNKIMTGWLNFLCGGNYTDTYTCYKLLERPLMRELDIRSRGFEMEAEISVKLAARGVSVRECPIHYRPRSLEEGKKIGWRDAVKGAWAVLVFWWEEGNRGFYERTFPGSR
jgi:dolichol-phosphate mannosyltransferase